MKSSAILDVLMNGIGALVLLVVLFMKLMGAPTAVRGGESTLPDSPLLFIEIQKPKGSHLGDLDFIVSAEHKNSGNQQTFADVGQLTTFISRYDSTNSLVSMIKTKDGLELVIPAIEKTKWSIRLFPFWLHEDRDKYPLDVKVWMSGKSVNARCVGNGKDLDLLRFPSKHGDQFLRASFSGKDYELVCSLN